MHDGPTMLPQSKKRSVVTQPVPVALFLFNVVGAAVYVIRASMGGWADPRERAAGIYSVTGEPFVWFVAIFPVVLFFFGLNLTWGVVIVRRHWRGISFWLLAALVWLGAIAIDFAHH
jgi:hypothetical protein